MTNRPQQTLTIVAILAVLLALTGRQLLLDLHPPPMVVDDDDSSGDDDDDSGRFSHLPPAPKE